MENEEEKREGNNEIEVKIGKNSENAAEKIEEVKNDI
jgi:hypothetical protein